MDNNEEIEVLEESSNKLKKGSSFGLIVIVILTIALAVACGWFANSYFTKSNSDLKSNQNKETTKQKEWKSLGTDISKVKDIYDTLKNYIYQKNLPDGGLSLDKREIMNVVASKVHESDLTDLKKEYDSGSGNLSYDKVENILKKLFNSNYIINTTPTCEYSHCSFGYWQCTSISSYNESTKNFSVGWGPCDGHGPSGPGETFKYYFDPLRKVIDVQEKSDEIKVIEKVVYVSFNPSLNGNIYDVYSDIQTSNQIGQLEVKSGDLLNNKNYVDQFLDKASTITSYYHKAEDGSYYFVRSEISN